MCYVLPTFSSAPLPEKQLVHSIESVVIDWCHQVRDVLKRRSAQALLDGGHPGPLVELNFWKIRWDDLESITEQVSYWCAYIASTNLTLY